MGLDEITGDSSLITTVATNFLSGMNAQVHRAAGYFGGSGGFATSRTLLEKDALIVNASRCPL